MPLNPLEALDCVIDGSCTLLHHTLCFGPGKLVERQKPEVREALQQLTSKMTQGQRVNLLAASGPFWYSEPVHAGDARDRTPRAHPEVRVAEASLDREVVDCEEGSQGHAIERFRTLTLRPGGR